MRKFMPFVVYETNDVASATPPTPAAPPAPVAAPPVQPAPVAAPAGDGPWAQDLAALFPDPEVRGQVDQFLRGKVQPHVTQVEQQYAPARELWQDLQGNESVGTYVAIAEQLYGPEVAAQVAATFQGQQPAAAPAQQPAAPQAQLTAEQQSALDWANAQRAEEMYKSELNRVMATESGTALQGVPDTVRDQVFAPFVQAAEGDFDQALNAFNHWQSIQAPAPPPAAPPPATLDGNAAPAAIPPTQPQRMTLDQALDETLAEMRAGAPATVGQV